VDCERAYLQAHMQSAATATEISSAVISACSREISAAVDAYMQDLNDRMEANGEHLGAAGTEKAEAQARAQITTTLSSGAMRLVVDGPYSANTMKPRAPAQPPSGGVFYSTQSSTNCRMSMRDGPSTLLKCRTSVNLQLPSAL
jgi:hypothetical protein